MGEVRQRPPLVICDLVHPAMLVEIESCSYEELALFLADLLTPAARCKSIFSAVRALVRWWSNDEFEDGLEARQPQSEIHATFRKHLSRTLRQLLSASFLMHFQQNTPAGGLLGWLLHKKPQRKDRGGLLQSKEVQPWRF